MTKSILLSIFFFIVIRLSAQQTDTNSITQKLDTFLTSANAADKFNGTAIISKKGKVLLNKGYGYRNVPSNSFNDSNSIYQIDSITKSFTAVVILKLQEQGHLSVQDKLNKFFPDYPQGDKITIQNLLTHTSGIYNYTNDIDENDCSFDFPKGPEPWGQRFVGKAQVREGLAGRFKGIPDVHYGEDRHWISADGTQGVSEWTLTGTTTSGVKLKVQGCDLWEFRNGKITRKDSYWKKIEQANQPTTK